MAEHNSSGSFNREVNITGHVDIDDKDAKKKLGELNEAIDEINNKTIKPNVDNKALQNGAKNILSTTKAIEQAAKNQVQTLNAAGKSAAEISEQLKKSIKYLQEYNAKAKSITTKKAANELKSSSGRDLFSNRMFVRGHLDKLSDTDKAEYELSQLLINKLDNIINGVVEKTAKNSSIKSSKTKSDITNAMSNKLNTTNAESINKALNSAEAEITKNLSATINDVLKNVKDTTTDSSAAFKKLSIELNRGTDISNKSAQLFLKTTGLTNDFMRKIIDIESDLESFKDLKPEKFRGFVDLVNSLSSGIGISSSLNKDDFKSGRSLETKSGWRDMILGQLDWVKEAIIKRVTDVQKIINTNVGEYSRELSIPDISTINKRNKVLNKFEGLQKRWLGILNDPDKIEPVEIDEKAILDNVDEVEKYKSALSIQIKQNEGLAEKTVEYYESLYNTLYSVMQLYTKIESLTKFTGKDVVINKKNYNDYIWKQIDTSEDFGKKTSIEKFISDSFTEKSLAGIVNALKITSGNINSAVKNEFQKSLNQVVDGIISDYIKLNNTFNTAPEDKVNEIDEIINEFAEKIEVVFGRTVANLITNAAYDIPEGKASIADATTKVVEHIIGTITDDLSLGNLVNNLSEFSLRLTTTTKTEQTSAQDVINTNQEIVKVNNDVIETSKRLAKSHNDVVEFMEHLATVNATIGDDGKPNRKEIGGVIYSDGTVISSVDQIDLTTNRLTQSLSVADPNKTPLVDVHTHGNQKLRTGEIVGDTGYSSGDISNLTYHKKQGQAMVAQLGGNLLSVLDIVNATTSDLEKLVTIFNAEVSKTYKNFNGYKKNTKPFYLTEEGKITNINVKDKESYFEAKQIIADILHKSIAELNTQVGKTAITYKEYLLTDTNQVKEFYKDLETASKIMSEKGLSKTGAQLLKEFITSAAKRDKINVDNLEQIINDVKAEKISAAQAYNSLNFKSQLHELDITPYKLEGPAPQIPITKLEQSVIPERKTEIAQTEELIEKQEKLNETERAYLKLKVDESKITDRKTEFPSGEQQEFVEGLAREYSAIVDILNEKEQEISNVLRAGLVYRANNILNTLHDAIKQNDGKLETTLGRDYFVSSKYTDRLIDSRWQSQNLWSPSQESLNKITTSDVTEQSRLVEVQIARIRQQEEELAKATELAISKEKTKIGDFYLNANDETRKLIDELTLCAEKIRELKAQGFDSYNSQEYLNVANRRNSIEEMLYDKYDFEFTTYSNLISVIKQLQTTEQAITNEKQEQINAQQQLIAAEQEAVKVQEESITTQQTRTQTTTVQPALPLNEKAQTASGATAAAINPEIISESNVKTEAEISKIKQVYSELLNVIQKINSINAEIFSMQKAGKTGAPYESYLAGLKNTRANLQNQLIDIQSKVSASSDTFKQGNMFFELPDVRSLNVDKSVILNFLNDVATQAELTQAQMDKLVETFNQAGKFDMSVAIDIASVLAPFDEINQRLANAFGGETQVKFTENLQNLAAKIAPLREQFAKGNISWDSQEMAMLKGLIAQYEKYGNALATAAEKENAYFKNKIKLTADSTLESIIGTSSTVSRQKPQAQKILEAKAKELAGDRVLLTSDFKTTANGISQLDFTVFDKGTNSLKNFKLELGSVTEQLGITETTVDKTAKTINNAQSQINKYSDMVNLLGHSEISVDPTNTSAQVKRMVEDYQLLTEEMNKVGGGDTNKIAFLTNNLKASTKEVERLYNGMRKLNNEIEDNPNRYQDLGIASLNQSLEAQLKEKVMSDYVSTFQNAEVKFGQFDSASGRMTVTVNELGKGITKATATVDPLTGKMNVLKTSMVEAKQATTSSISVYDKFKSTLGNIGKQLLTATIGYNVFYKAISMFRNGIGYVKDIDLAMTELKKVTDNTAETYDKFIEHAYDAAGKVGATVSEFTEATANFARLGYNINEASDMAETAIVYKNVADGIDDINVATESIISTMKAFGVEANNTMSIADKFNEVGNNFAITSSGIGEALTRSASALAASGNSIDESIALVTGSNAVVQNPEAVGTALKTLSLRIRGVKTELEDAGLETEGMAENTSKLQAKLLALTHGEVDVMKNANEFKNTTEILRELAGAWEHMTDIEQAAAIELVAGKRQANIVASLMKNFDVVEDAIQTSANSSGSALAENEKYLNSIAGKTQKLARSTQEYWNRLADSDIIKFFIDVAQSVMNFVNTLGPAQSSILAIVSAFSLLNKTNPIALFKGIWSQMAMYGDTKNLLSSINPVAGTSVEAISQNVQMYAAAVRNLTAQEQAYMLGKQQLNQSMIEQVLITNGVQEADAKALALQNAKINANNAEMASEKMVIISRQQALAFIEAEKKTEEELAAQDFLLAFGSEGITKSKLQEAVASNLITEAMQKEIITKYELDVVNNKLATGAKGFVTALKMSPTALLGGAMIALPIIIGIVQKIKNVKEELSNTVKEVRTEYENNVKEIDNSKKTITDLTDEYTKLSKGVSDHGENMSLTADEYKRYQEIVKQVTSLTPAVIEGYNAEGEAIVNKNELLERSIELLEQEQKLEAKKATSGENKKDFYKDQKNKVKEQLDKNEENLKLSRDKALSFLSRSGIDTKDLMDAYGFSQSEAINVFDRFDSKEAQQVIDNFGKIREKLSEENQITFSALIADYNNILAVGQNEMQGILKAYNDNIKTTIHGTDAYWDLEDYRGLIDNFISGLEIGEDTDVQALENKVLSAVNVLSSNADTLFGTFDDLQNKLSTTDTNGISKTYQEWVDDIEGLRQAIYDDSNIGVSDKNILFELLGIDKDYTKEYDEYNKTIISKIKTGSEEIIQAKKDAEAELATEMQWAKEYGYDFKQTKFGNVDMNDRPVLFMDEATINKNKAALESWGESLEDIYETTMTVFGGVDEFGDVDIAFTPVIKTPDGGKLLSADELYDYIDSLIGELGKGGKSWTTEDLLSLDAKGIEKDGVLIQNVIADIGETANQTSMVMHSAGEFGALAMAENNLAKFDDEITTTSWDIMQFLSGLSLADIKLASTLDFGDATISLNQLEVALAEAKAAMYEMGSADTYSTLTTAIDNYNSVLKATQEIVTDNIQVTQEYKDSLIALGIAEDDLTTAFGEENGLVVKSAGALKKLVKEAKNNQVTNVKLAKSQAMLRYHQLQKETSKLAGNYKTLTSSERNTLNAMLQEMSALQNNIARYSILEHSLLGASNAYERFAEAQELDSQNTYLEQAENMLSALAEGFNTAKIGTFAFQEAVKGLVPESVYGDLDNLGESMNSIYNYFSSGELSKYITTTFDDQGKIEKVTIELDNLKRLVSEGAGKVFTEGSTWEAFDLDPQIQTLDQFAEGLGITKEAAFALLQEMEKYDMSWLAGDNATLLDKLTSSSADYETQLYKASIAFNELDRKLIDGTISTEEYATESAKLNATMNELGNNIAHKVSRYEELGKEVDKVGKELSDAHKELSKDPNNAKQIAKVNELVNKYAELVREKENLGTVSEYEVTAALDAMGISADNASAKLNEVRQAIDTLGNDNKKLQDLLSSLGLVLDTKDGHISIKVDAQAQVDAETKNLVDKATNSDGETIDISVLLQSLPSSQKLELEQLNELIEQQNLIEYSMEMDGEDAVQKSLNSIKTTLNNLYRLFSQGTRLHVDASGANSTINNVLEKIKEFNGQTFTAKMNITETTTKKLVWEEEGGSGGGKWGAWTGDLNGTAHYKGTAYAGGSWGAQRTETALVGELGSELRVDSHTGRWELLGQNGAEFAKINKGDVIFNHKQTQSLLANGYVNSRGKAYLNGTAYAGGTGAGGVNTWTPPTGNNNNTNNSQQVANNAANAAASTAQAASDFKDIFDEFAVLLEEINESLDYMNAEVENLVKVSDKNGKLTSVIDTNKYKLKELAEGLKLYSDYANELLQLVPQQYREAAQNGAVAIERFAGDAGEKTLEAINNYRTWAQNVADLKQQMVELNQTIVELAKQKFDNINDAYERQLGLTDAIADRIQAAIKLQEDKGNIATIEYYNKLWDIEADKLDALKDRHNDLQKELDESVKAGDIQVNSETWYDMVNAIADVDTEIDDCVSSLEEYQNAINKIHWDRFDELAKRLDYVNDDAQSLIDLLGEIDELIDYPKEQEYWFAREVGFTKKGLTTMGLYAQQLSIAEYKSKQYAEAIKDLTAQYEQGRYSQSEYLEKLSSLKKEQNESIKAYNAAKKAIVELEKQRIDAIKNGIDKEIAATEKLINKRKEEISDQKNAYEWQKTVTKKEQDIIAIERKIAAMSGDTSLLGVAERKRLEAELANARLEMAETYRDREIEDQQTALDKTLEAFKQEKEDEKEYYDKYLEDTEKVVADSLAVVKNGTTDIFNTIQEVVSEYSLTITDAISAPWAEGESAITDYQKAFGQSANETYNKLIEIAEQWDKIIEKMVKVSKININSITDDAAEHIAATYQAPNTTTNNTTTGTTDSGATNDGIGVGTRVSAAGAKIYATPDGKAYNQYYGNDPVYDIIGEQDGYWQVRYHGASEGESGWFKKEDVKKFAKGTLGVKKNQIATIDELGEELVLHASNGRLAYLTKGTSVVPADITKNLMEIGSINPQEVLDRSRAAISPYSNINGSGLNVNISYGEVLHIDHFDGSNPEAVIKLISAELDKHDRKLNENLRRFAR